jgi:hypothetical protein
VFHNFILNYEIKKLLESQRFISDVGGLNFYKNEFDYFKMPMYSSDVVSFGKLFQLLADFSKLDNKTLQTYTQYFN